MVVTSLGLLTLAEDGAINPAQGWLRMRY